MPLSAVQTPGLLDLASWQADVAQLLEEHHLVAWSHGERDRLHFGGLLAEYLRQLPDTEVCIFHGQNITNFESFCSHLERALPGGEVRRTVDGPRGVIQRLRARRNVAGGSPAKTRYYLWQDANVLLRRDHRLFGRLVDAITGVAAEAEYASEDRLLIHRAVFLGAPSLDAYAEDPRGQFRTWLRERREPALWQVVSGLLRPPILRFHITPLHDLAS